MLGLALLGSYRPLRRLTNPSPGSLAPYGNHTHVTIVVMEHHRFPRPMSPFLIHWRIKADTRHWTSLLQWMSQTNRRRKTMMKWRTMRNPISMMSFPRYSTMMTSSPVPDDYWCVADDDSICCAVSIGWCVAPFRQTAPPARADPCTYGQSAGSYCCTGTWSVAVGFCCICSRRPIGSASDLECRWNCCGCSCR